MNYGRRFDCFHSPIPNDLFRDIIERIFEAPTRVTSGACQSRGYIHFVYEERLYDDFARALSSYGRNDRIFIRLLVGTCRAGTRKSERVYARQYRWRAIDKELRLA